MANLKSQYKRERNRLRFEIKQLEEAGLKLDIDIPSTPKHITRESINSLKSIKLPSIPRPSVSAELSGDTVQLKRTGGRKRNRRKLEQYQRKRSVIPIVEEPKGKKARRRKKKEKLENKKASKKQKTKPKKQPKVKQKKQEKTRDRYTDNGSIYDDAIIANYKENILQFDALQGVVLLVGWINAMINEHGKHDVAVMLQKGAEAGLLPTFEMMYSTQLTKSLITQLLNFLPEVGQYTKDRVIDAIEEGEYMSEFYY